MRIKLELFKYLLVVSLLFTYSSILLAQVGIGTTSPHHSAILDIHSNNKGILLPRFNKIDRDSKILNPALGLVVYCNDCCVNGALSIYDGVKWKNISSVCDDTDDIIPPEIPEIPELPQIKEIIGAGHTVKFHNIYITVPTEDGDLYGIGKNNLGQLGLNDTQDRNQIFNKIDLTNILDANEKVLQAHCLGATASTSIILTDKGRVFTSGTMFNTQNKFEQLDLNNEVAIGLASSEEGFVVITNSQKCYAYGNISNKNQGSTPHISTLPVSFEDIIALDGGGSNILLFTNNDFYTLGQNNYANNYPTSTDLIWNEGKSFGSSLPWTFNNISKIDVGKNSILLKDDDGIISFSNNSFNSGARKPFVTYSPNTITHSDIVDFSVSNNGMFFTTIDKVLTGTGTTATTLNLTGSDNDIDSNYDIVQFTGSSSLEFIYVKGKHKITGEYEIFSYKSGTENNLLGNFQGNKIKIAFPEASYNGATKLLF